MSSNIRATCIPSCKSNSSSCCKTINFRQSSSIVRSDIVMIILEKMIASIIIALASPLMLIIALAIKFISNGDVFYRGIRLGERKKIFNLYKFRTLPNDFQQRNGAKLVSSKDDIPPFFRFLRESRLDELPQFVNIIKGDMQFVGPRPERPEVYDEKCKYIKNYDVRFSKRPGLIGYSQIFTPHGTSKRMRTIIDNRFTRKSSSECFFFMLYATIKLIQNMIFKYFCLIRKYYVNLFIIKGDEKRMQDRKKQKNTYMYISSKGSQEKNFLGEVLDVNEDYFSVMTSKSIDEINLSMIIEKQVKSKNKIKKIIVHCDGEVYAKRNHSHEDYSTILVIKHENVSPLNCYKISRYFLNQGIVNAT